MDGTYDHSIKIQRSFFYGAEPKSIYNHCQYNWWGPAIRPNALNHVKEPLEACGVAGGLRRELILHLILYCNQNAHLEVNHLNDTFAGYKCNNISITKIYHFPGMLLEISLISSDVNGFKSFWYPLT